MGGWIIGAIDFQCERPTDGQKSTQHTQAFVGAAGKAVVVADGDGFVSVLDAHVGGKNMYMYPCIWDVVHIYVSVRTYFFWGGGNPSHTISRPPPPPNHTHATHIHTHK